MEKPNNKTVSIFDKVVVMILVGIVPFLVYLNQYEYVFPTTEEVAVFYDYFNLVKVRIILITATAIAFNAISDKLLADNTYVYKDPADRFKNINKNYLFVGLIVFSVILAFIFSPVKSVALSGAYERFESIWIHFSYMIIFVYFLNLFKKEGSFKIFSYAILLATFVVGFIGTLQYFGFNPFMTEFVKSLTTDGTVEIQNNSVGSYTTLYNTNTSSAYALLMMFVLTVIIFINKNIFVKFIAIIDIGLMFVTFANSLSEASYIAFVAAIGFMLLLKLFVLVKKQKYAVAGIITVLITLGLVGIIGVIKTNVTVQQKIDSAIKSAIGPESQFSDWSQDGNIFYFYNKDDEYIKVEVLKESFEIYEGETHLESIPVTNAEDINLQTENFDNLLLFTVYDSEKVYYLYFNDYFLIRNVDNPTLIATIVPEEIQHIDFVGFEGYGNAFTNRGYIWSRSIPLFLERPLVGYGSDVYFHVFPHNDYAGLAFYNQPEVLVDKPHNIYLNMAINNGILYLIGFIGIVCIALFSKFSLLNKSGENANINWKAVIFYIGGIVAYLINGLSTDNIVVIIMMFWIYLSIGNEVFIDDKNEVKEDAVVVKDKVIVKEEVVVKDDESLEVAESIETVEEIVEEATEEIEEN